MKDNAEDQAIVYSLKSKTWRSIDKFPIPIPSSPYEAGVLSRGALHWWSKEEDPRSLIAFDLSKEKFEQFSTEPESDMPCRLGILLDGEFCETMELYRGYYEILLRRNNNESIQFDLNLYDTEVKCRCRGTKPLLEVPLLEVPEGWFRPIAYVESPKPLVMMYQAGLTDNLFFYDLENSTVSLGEASNMDVSKEVLPYIKTLEFN